MEAYKLTNEQLLVAIRCCSSLKYPCPYDCPMSTETTFDDCGGMEELCEEYLRRKKENDI